MDTAGLCQGKPLPVDDGPRGEGKGTTQNRREAHWPSG